MNESRNNKNIVRIPQYGQWENLCDPYSMQIYGVAALMGLTTAAYWMGYKAEGTGGRLKEKGMCTPFLTLPLLILEFLFLQANETASSVRK